MYYTERRFYILFYIIYCLLFKFVVNNNNKECCHDIYISAIAKGLSVSVAISAVKFSNFECHVTP